MNKILKELIKNVNETKEFSFYQTKGNYAVSKVDNIIKHYYYWNMICVVDIKNKTFNLNSCGYSSCRLTIAQLNYLKDFYSNKGFILINYIR